MKLSRWTLHPVLFSIQPVISLVSYNIHDLPWSEVIRPLLAALAAGILILLLLQARIQNWHRAGAAASLFWILFYSYGHFHAALGKNALAPFFRQEPLAGHMLLLSAWAVLLALGSGIILRLPVWNPIFTGALNLMAVGALAMPALATARYEWSLRHPLETVPASSLNTTETTIKTSSETSPDIYYIILDGYGRADVLLESYHLDNSPFLRELEEMGFYVAARSRANYAQTVLSLSSSLNMSYLDFLAEDGGEHPMDPSLTARLIRWNAVERFLKNRGYKIVAFSTGNRATEWENADVYVHPPVTVTTAFEHLVIATSALSAWEDWMLKSGLFPTTPGYEAHRRRILYNLSQVKKISGMPGPKFVFLHLILPHPPFVFGPKGERVSQTYPFTLMDADGFRGDTKDYTKGYHDQVLFTNRLILDLLTYLQNSQKQPIIIIQGDHGPAASLQWDTPSYQSLFDRAAILNAYLLPGSENNLLYATISPVNTFRVIFNTYFGTRYPLLPDHFYYSNLKQPYNFKLVTP